MSFIVMRHNVDTRGDITDSEGTGYEFDTEQEARDEAESKNDLHGGPFVLFTAEEVID